MKGNPGVSHHASNRQLLSPAPSTVRQPYPRRRSEPLTLLMPLRPKRLPNLVNHTQQAAPKRGPALKLLVLGVSPLILSLRLRVQPPMMMTMMMILIFVFSIRIRMWMMRMLAMLTIMTLLRRRARVYRRLMRVGDRGRV